MKKIKRRDRFYTYIVRCKDNTFYTGYTKDLEKRVKEHNEGKRGAKYTRSRRPVKLVWFKEYRSYINAVREERRIKKLKRVQKERLIS
ncbi:MAG: GIY-YIG nuclease family protein [Candidatus Omnitrophica bacterium]|nr:GIY-YIG nuclease family protein [Candidatus Omnitrophota bacterium]